MAATFYSPRVAQITPLPDAFYRYAITTAPLLAASEFREVMSSLFALVPPVHDRWTESLRPHGYDTLEILLNVPGLAEQWALENGVPNPADEIDFAIAQLERFKPDILLVRDHLAFSAADIDRIRERCRTIRAVVGWVGAPPVEPAMISRFDVIFSCMPNYVENFRQEGASAHIVHHAFEPAWLATVQPLPERDISLSFIGSVYGFRGIHETRQRMLEALVRELPVTVFGRVSNQGARYLLKASFKSLLWSLKDSLNVLGVPRELLSRIPLLRSVDGPSRVKPVTQRLLSSMRPPVWGREMYRTLARSRITWNCHIDAVGPFAANVRLFEATGMGCCLVTDAKKNLRDFFEPDYEVVAFSNIEECVEKTRWLMDNPAKALEIGNAGKIRCLAQHTFEHRAQEIDRLLRSVV